MWVRCPLSQLERAILKEIFQEESHIAYMIHYVRWYLKDAMESTYNALTKQKLVSRVVYIPPALLEMCCAKAYEVYDSRRPQPMLGGKPLPRESNNP